MARVTYQGVIQGLVKDLAVLETVKIAIQAVQKNGYIVIINGVEVNVNDIKVKKNKPIHKKYTKPCRVCQQVEIYKYGKNEMCRACSVAIRKKKTKVAGNDIIHIPEANYEVKKKPMVQAQCKGINDQWESVSDFPSVVATPIEVQADEHVTVQETTL